MTTQVQQFQVGDRVKVHNTVTPDPSKTDGTVGTVTSIVDQADIPQENLDEMVALGVDWSTTQALWVAFDEDEDPVTDAFFEGPLSTAVVSVDLVLA